MEVALPDKQLTSEQYRGEEHVHGDGDQKSEVEVEPAGGDLGDDDVARVDDERRDGEDLTHPLSSPGRAATSLDNRNAQGGCFRRPSLIVD
nr:hypothetical protein [Rubrobacter marinus]